MKRSYKIAIGALIVLLLLGTVGACLFFPGSLLRTKAATKDDGVGCTPTTNQPGKVQVPGSTQATWECPTIASLNTSTGCLHIRPLPMLSTHPQQCIKFNQKPTVDVLCQTTGDAVNTPNGIDTVWDEIIAPSQAGIIYLFVSDAFISTPGVGKPSGITNCSSLPVGQGKYPPV